MSPSLVAVLALPVLVEAGLRQRLPERLAIDVEESDPLGREILLPLFDQQIERHADQVISL